MNKEALFYEILKNNVVKCKACYRNCIIKENNTGFCGVRKNIKGKLYSLVYNKPIAIHVDPIEKKPIFMFLKKTKTLSIGTVGCNFDCSFCQNYDISKVDGEIYYQTIVDPKEIIKLAKENNCPSISYTYTEPTIFVEYALEIMKLAKKENIKNIWVTNGYMTKEVLEEIIKYLDAANVDLKGDAGFYKKQVNNIDINKIKENIKQLYKKKIHVEITNLLIEEHNTKEKQIEEIVDFVASVSKEIPLHFTRCFPCYELTNIIPTKIKTIHLAKEIAKKKGLKHVFVGNI
jgi:pyruvate formate lyase activating enzyme